MSVEAHISRLEAAKADLKAALEAKGQTVPDTARLPDFAPLIAAIETGNQLPDEISGAEYHEITFAAGTNSTTVYHGLGKAPLFYVMWKKTGGMTSEYYKAYWIGAVNKYMVYGTYSAIWLGESEGFMNTQLGNAENCFFDDRVIITTAGSTTENDFLTGVPYSVLIMAA